MATANSILATREPSVETQPWPPEDLERVMRCPVCGSTSRTPLHKGLTDCVFFCTSEAWMLYSCAGCESAYLDPRPTPASISRAYRKYFTHTSNEPAAEEVSLFRRLRRTLANGYRNWRFGTSLEPAQSAGVALAWLLPGLRARLDAGLRYIPKQSGGAQLLDIGAGNGHFLAQARTAGWAVVGVEPDPKAVAVCCERGLDVREGGVEQLEAEHRHFDYITVSHVIEHVHEPRELLQNAFDLLKPGGTLYVDTPNVDAYGHQRFGRYWRGLEPPRHLVLFNWASLDGLLQRVGFSMITHKPRPVYPELAAASKALSRGRDCYAAFPSIADRLIGQVRSAKLVFSHLNSEYVTLLARKL